jgi:hypothetical protein
MGTAGLQDCQLQEQQLVWSRELLQAQTMMVRVGAVSLLLRQPLHAFCKCKGAAHLQFTQQASGACLVFIALEAACLIIAAHVLSTSCRSPDLLVHHACNRSLQLQMLCHLCFLQALHWWSPNPWASSAVAPMAK